MLLLGPGPRACSRYAVPVRHPEPSGLCEVRPPQHVRRPGHKPALRACDHGAGSELRPLSLPGTARRRQDGGASCCVAVI